MLIRADVKQQTSLTILTVFCGGRNVLFNDVGPHLSAQEAAPPCVACFGGMNLCALFASLNLCVDFRLRA